MGQSSGYLRQFMAFYKHNRWGMHSFNELNLLDSIEIRGLKVWYNEVCQITLWNRAKILELSFYTSFPITKQIHSL